MADKARIKGDGINAKLYDALVAAMTPEIKAALREACAVGMEVLERVERERVQEAQKERVAS